MSGRKLACAALAVVGMLSTGAAWAQIVGIPRKGGFVQPCSLDGVNPVHHPDIFGNPAVAFREYGFVQARDGSWRVIPNCHR